MSCSFEHAGLTIPLLPSARSRIAKRFATCISRLRCYSGTLNPKPRAVASNTDTNNMNTNTNARNNTNAISSTNTNMGV